MSSIARTLSFTLLAAVPAFGQSAPTPAPPEESSAFPARLGDVEGSVRVAQGGTGLRAASLNMPVLAGTQVSTGGDGRAEIQFNDGTLARLTPNSSLVVVALPSGGEEVRAVRGLSYFETPDNGAGALTVDAGPDTVKLDGASLLRFDLDQPPFKAAVLRGTAHFTAAQGDTSFDAREGQTASLDPAAADSYDVNDELAQVSWDNWNADRDQTLAELAQSQTNARAGNGDANAPGWNDLDYYGTWYDVPGQGMAWAPDGVDQNFDPYGAGSWGYYSGVGYTWVSAYPWGWLPYHSGGWSYFPGFGWGWQPGGGGYNGVGWYPYSGVHGAPANYRLPLPMDARLRTRLAGAPLPPPVALHGAQPGAGTGASPARPVTVSRGPQYGFRPLGGARPEPRQFPIANGAAANGSAPTFAPTVPVVQPGRGAYGGPGQGFAGRQGYVGAAQPGFGPGYGGAGYGGPGYNQGAQGARVYQGQPGQRIVTPGPNVITPTPRVLPAPGRVITPPPRVIVPQPAPQAAPTHIAPPAVAAPAGPRGH